MMPSSVAETVLLDVLASRSVTLYSLNAALAEIRLRQGSMQQEVHIPTVMRRVADAVLAWKALVGENGVTRGEEWQKLDEAMSVLDTHLRHYVELQ